MLVAQFAAILQPLGVPGAIVAFVVVGLLYIRRNQLVDNRELISYQALETRKMREDVAAARKEADEAREREDDARDMAQFWHARAHEQRLSRVTDRTYFYGVMTRAGLAPNPLPDVPELPAFVEEEDNARK